MSEVQPIELDPILRLPNVIAGTPHKGQTLDNAQLRQLKFDPIGMRNIVEQFAIHKPEWSFTLVMPPSYPTVDKVKVHCGSELLGEITREWFNRRYVIGVRSHRAANGIGKHRTADVQKAAALVKKMFVPRNRTELLANAANEAGSVIYNVYRNFHYERDNLETRMRKHAIAFSMEHRSEFADYLTNVGATEVANGLTKHEEAALNLITVEKVKSLFESDKTALVLLDGGDYVVKIGGSVDVYNDTTLPTHMRGKLGMLKLVEQGQVVSDIGCRVNDNVFVVVIDEGATNVE